MNKMIFPALAGALLMGGTASAQVSTTGAGGVAAAGPNGAVAGGAGVTQASPGRERAEQRRMDRQRDRAGIPNQATTSTTGSVYTTRDSGAAAINTNGAASGAGAVSSSSEGDVYSSTDRTGSSADAYGNSTATVDKPRRRPR